MLKFSSLGRQKGEKNLLLCSEGKTSLESNFREEAS